ncbi:MAG: shikimate dehydrogenase [Candidatus Tectomicrobia bacterium]|nr:shikimate dehydrogenase [Candidatus Tectomicrobia bacterium]
MTSLVRALGVLGFPLGHTLSPLMYETALAELGLPYRFLAFEVPPERLGDAVLGIRALGIHGVALTIPHKEAVIAHLDGLTEEARRTGAVNLIFRDKGRLIGHNTDGAGFVRSLREEGDMEPRGRRFLLLGAGGAARGIALELAARGAAELTIANRTVARALALAEWVRKAFGSVRAEGVPLGGREAEAAAGGADAVVQCTPLGLMGHGGEEGGLPLAPECLRRGQVVVDIVYRPLETPFLRAARARGARAVGGLGMLVFQGAENFRLWTGRELPVEKVRAAMEAALAAEGGRR